MPDNIPATPQPASTAPKIGVSPLQPQTPPGAGTTPPSNPSFPLPPGIRLSSGSLPLPQSGGVMSSPQPAIQPPVSQAPSAPIRQITEKTPAENNAVKPPIAGMPPLPIPKPLASASQSTPTTPTQIFSAPPLPKPEVKTAPPFPKIPAPAISQAPAPSSLVSSAPAPMSPKPLEQAKPQSIPSAGTALVGGAAPTGPRPMVKPGVLLVSPVPASAPRAPSPNPALASASRPLAPLSSVPPTPPIPQPKPLVSAEAPALSAGMRPSGTQPMRPAQLEKKPFPLKLVALIVGAFALVGIIALVVRNLTGSQTSGPSLSQTNGGAQTPTVAQNITLTYWGLWEPAPVMKEIFQEFQKQNPGVTIEYIQQSPKDYRERLQDAITKGTGPDVFRFHGSWVPMMSRELSAIPSSVLSEAEYNQQFYPVFGKTLKTTKGLVGIPHMYEGLGLYYNTEVFNVAKQTPPKTWPELTQVATNLTIRSKGKIEQAGVALGTATNVDNFSDILALIILQNSGYPEDLSTKNSADAYEFYVNFAKSLKVWDETLPNSTYAFATGKVAMMIAPSWRAHEVLAINPNLKFAIAPVPQLKVERPVTFASFWAEGVSSSSKNSEMAWRLLKFMSSKEMLQKFYESAAKNTPRKFGELYPRPDMANLVATDPYVASYLSDAPTAQTWFMSSRTFDSGINDKIIKYVEDAITSIYTSGDLAGTLVTAQQGIQQVLQTYGVAPRSSSTGAAPAATGM